MPLRSQPKRLLLAAFLALVATSNLTKAQAEKDPHRPACTTAPCQKLKSFTKAHYCGQSPAGNGPVDGCLIKTPDKLQAGTVIVHYRCQWNETANAQQCDQHGQPAPMIRDVLLNQLRRLGLPSDAKGHTYFTVWKSNSGWTLAGADYSRLAGTDLELCSALVILDQNSRVVPLRQLPFVQTDPEVPAVTRWSPIDLANVTGDGTVSIVLEGGAYEDHWIEVVTFRDGVAKTVFSGLGYYL